MDISALNVNVGGRPVLGYKGDGSVIRELEALVGAPLPASYLDFIRSVDGGHPEVGCFPVPGGDSENLVEVDWFYSLETSGVEKLRFAIEKYCPTLGPQTLPIGRDGGGNQFYLLLNSEPPSVWIYLHDEGGKRVKLADTLEMFLFGLILNPDLI
ncbi:SMI1/KNR4 family protein [Luteimonas panaciterrae]|uniref:SMI1/KNR4 family protein n=1 Tax=Luteimonas panaciterrae TaxID=363885 RepID=UPI001CFA3D66|nr:SMI1/KNR4 family protein [Luteimonas panaciterrae]